MEMNEPPQDYPNIRAMAAGTVSGAWREWPRVRPEAKAVLAALEQAQEQLRDERKFCLCGCHVEQHLASEEEQRRAFLEGVEMNEPQELTEAVRIVREEARKADRSGWPTIAEEIDRLEAERDALRAETDLRVGRAGEQALEVFREGKVWGNYIPAALDVALRTLCAEANALRAAHHEVQARAERAEAALKAEKVNCPWMERALKVEAALREIEQATEGIPEQNCMIANRIARVALRGTAPELPAGLEGY